MEQEKNEIFMFKGKEYKVTPEQKVVCERLKEILHKHEELRERCPDFEFSPEVSRELQQELERIVAKIGLDSHLADVVLKTRA